MVATHATHACKAKDVFCYVCAKYQKVKNRNQFTDKDTDMFKKAYKVKKLKNLNKDFTPNMICTTCRRNMVEYIKKNKPLKFKRPAIWCVPEGEKDCYCCQTKQRHELIVFKALPKKFDGKRNFNVFAAKYKTLPDDDDDSAVAESDSNEE